jgi:tetratricopeptide (TPR) repeat protein
MRTVSVLCLLLAVAAPAEAFLFGGASDKKAAAVLSGMRSAFGRGDCDSVLDISDSFLEEKPSAGLREEAYGYMGRCYENQGLADKAIGLYKLALGLYPGNILFAGRLAAIYNQAGFSADAVPLFLKVLDIRSDDIDANLGLGRAYASLGFYSKAKGFYSRAVVLQDFGDPAVLREYAFCMLKKGDWGEAVYIAGKGAQAEPGSSDWKLIEARSLAGQGDYRKAVADMDAGINISPSRRLRLERALYLLLSGDKRLAAEAADRELAVDGTDPLASLIKGMSLYSLGEKTEAARYFEAARAGGPFTSAVAGSFLGNASGKPEEACKK